MGVVPMAGLESMARGGEVANESQGQRSLLSNQPEVVMPQFAVYLNKNLRSRWVFPMLVDVQSELLRDPAASQERSCRFSGS
jgi:hypothetical protein